jgi:hypothetical protein
MVMAMTTRAFIIIIITIIQAIKLLELLLQENASPPVPRQQKNQMVISESVNLKLLCGTEKTGVASIHLQHQIGRGEDD